MDVPMLAKWAQLKGITVMGTGDFTHPFWQQELQEYLQEAESGLFTLKPTYQASVDQQVYDSCKALQRFMLTAEISTIFKRKQRVYKMHSLILAPSWQAVFKISQALAKIGNITADGRPILGCDVKDLLKIVLDASPDCMLIPAHIWTPWFGLLGSKSGFDLLETCFEELTDQIYALETGLSSNFLMNARLSQLDRFVLLCNSDAHSVQNLGREANIMHTQLSYAGIRHALMHKESGGLEAGIEVFPETGKYYGDGHRACKVYTTPQETALCAGRCRQCQRLLTIGVANRVEQLADRNQEQAQEYVKKRYRIIALRDILQQHFGFSQTSKKMEQLYHHMLQVVGPELYILLQAPYEVLEKAIASEVAKKIIHIRLGQSLIIQPGYDGVYGQVQW